MHIYKGRFVKHGCTDICLVVNILLHCQLLRVTESCGGLNLFALSGLSLLYLKLRRYFIKKYTDHTYHMVNTI